MAHSITTLHIRSQACACMLTLSPPQKKSMCPCMVIQIGNKELLGSDDTPSID